MATFAVLAAAVAGLGYVATPIAREVIGVGRTIENVRSTPGGSPGCIKLPQLAGCEDFWLHHPTGLLYAACGEPNAKKKWFPGMAHTDATGRSLDDAIYILDTSSDLKNNPRITKLKLNGFSGNNGDGTVNLHGIAAYVLPADTAAGEVPTVRIFFNNHRPSLDPATGALLDNLQTGANSTVEIFETTLGSDSATHIKTFADPLIHTVNRMAPVGPDSFLFTNDHQRKTKPHYRDYVELLYPHGSVGYCDAAGCKIVSEKHYLPNGIVRVSQTEQRYIVPHSGRGHLDVVDWDVTRKVLTKAGSIFLGMPSDNVAIDDTGAAVTASFPALLKTADALGKGDPYNPAHKAPGAVFRIPASELRSLKPGDGRDPSKGWHAEKFYEGDGSDVNVITTANIDSRRGRLIITGPTAPALAICDVPM